MRARLLPVVAAVALLVGTVPPSAAGEPPAYDGPMSLIVFSTDRGDTGLDLWTVNPADPSDVRQLTDFPGNEMFPRWSPDEF